MLIQIWLGLLTAVLLGLCAFFVWTALLARRHRMVTEVRMDDLGRQIAQQADALHRRCDHLLAKVDRLETLGDRVRLLELDRQVTRLADGGRISAGVSRRLEGAVADLRADVAAKEP